MVCATTSPASFFPSTAVLVAEAVGAHGAGAYDLAAACTGFPYALSQAIGQIQAGLAEHALVIGADTLSKVLDWDDRATCILFGDGAGAVVLSADAAGEHTLAIELGADGARAGDLYVHALDPSDRFLRMNGGEVYKFATRTMVDASTRLLERTGLDGGGRRLVDTAPGEPADHRSCRPALGDRPRPRADQPRPIRQHVGRLHPHLPRRSMASRTHSGR